MGHCGQENLQLQDQFSSAFLYPRMFHYDVSSGIRSKANLKAGYCRLRVHVRGKRIKNLEPVSLCFLIDSVFLLLFCINGYIRMRISPELRRIIPGVF